MNKIALMLLSVTLVASLSLTACVPGVAPSGGGGGMMGGQGRRNDGRISTASTAARLPALLPR